MYNVPHKLGPPKNENRWTGMALLRANTKRMQQHKKHNHNHTFLRIGIRKQRATGCKSLRNTVAMTETKFSLSKTLTHLADERCKPQLCVQVCMCECVNTSFNGWLSESLEQASLHCDREPPLTAQYCRSIHWVWLLISNFNSQQARLH